MTRTRYKASMFALTLSVSSLCFIEISFGQPMTFSSGSTGVDGALNITTPGVTYFNPKAMNLNPAIPNIFNFTTITIAAGATLKLTEEVFHGPAFFLASGNVDIEGTLDVSGGTGSIGGAANQSDRLPSYAGSGGYGGGLGGGLNGTIVPEAGNGPGGGTAGAPSSGNGSGGQFTGNQYLVPLIGGAGGGGAFWGCNTSFAATGGAGGGAILIASSTSITVNGSINASGGAAVNTVCISSGGGSGGAIRLIANTIGGSGLIQSQGGGNTITGSQGFVRLEAFQQNFPTGNIQSSFAQSTPYALALPATGPSSVTVTSINGIAINANPFSFPDATINSSAPITVNIQAQYIPPGTVPKLTIFSETGPDKVISGSPLTGTLQQSTSTANITFPPGGSRGFVKATWSQ